MSALITHGSLESLLSRPAAPLRDLGAGAGPADYKLTQSASKRGLALKNLRLTEGFEGFFRRLFDPTHAVYFVAWGWDFSGIPPFEYPGIGASPESVVIPLKVGKTREFLGAGIPLFPVRNVSGGLAVRIMLWESDKGDRDFGKKLADVSSAIKTSSLTSVLSAVSLASGVTGATVALAANAALELSSVVGTLLKANGDDYVDLYEGYYPAEQAWTPGDESHSGNSSEIVLSRLSS